MKGVGCLVKDIHSVSRCGFEACLGDEKSVILLLKFAGVRKLLKVFVHETVQQPLWLQYQDLGRMAMTYCQQEWCLKVH